MLVWGVGVLFTIVGFLVGKIFSQTEQVIEQKRRVYEKFLEVCPAPNEAHTDRQFEAVDFQRQMGVLTLYASRDSLQFAAEYFQVFADAQSLLVNVHTPGHPKFIEVMTAYNRMVWSMRTDVMAWSSFAPRKRDREYRPSFPQGAGRSGSKNT
jgi:hypothetical protein